MNFATLFWAGLFVGFIVGAVTSVLVWVVLR